LSQGTLQGIYEYQTMICQIYGMDVSNASMYDGGTALAEGALMTIGATRRRKLVVAGTLHPAYRQVLRTYTVGLNVEIVEVPWDPATLQLIWRLCARRRRARPVSRWATPTSSARSRIMAEIGRIAHGAGALFLVASYPMALGLLKPPGAFDADIAIGEGQCFGAGLNFGGPYLGVLTCKQNLVRLMPGRVVGVTATWRGARLRDDPPHARAGYPPRARDLQYLHQPGPHPAHRHRLPRADGGRAVSRRWRTFATRRRTTWRSRSGRCPASRSSARAPYFNEFVVRLPRPAAEVNAALLGLGFIGGYDLATDYPNLGDAMLLCATS
jgi:glycine dehydrogenase subunit 1